MHASDRPIAQAGAGFRPLKAAPGLLRGLMFRMFVPFSRKVDAATIDHEMTDGQTLPIAGGPQVIHVPGHCLGQVALLWPSRGVLIAGDACSNLFGLGGPLGYEDQAEDVRSQKKLSGFDFSIVCVGHGKPILHDALGKFRERFANHAAA